MSDWSPKPATVQLVSAAAAAIAEANDDGYRPTLRRVFYALVSANVIRHRYPDRATARRSIFEWLVRYNTTRRHTSLDCLTPDQYEAHYRHTAETTPALST